MISRLLTQPCTITTRTAAGRDDDFDPIITEEAVDTVCFLDRAGADELQVSGDVATIDGTLYLLAAEAITPQSAVTVGGATYEVVGQVDEVWNPRTAQVSHIRCHVRRDTP